MQLPAELWVQILRTATDIPDAFDTAYQSPIDRHWPISDYHRTDSFRTIHTPRFAIKRILVKVCRTWNSIATRFLYEMISLRTEKDIKLLARTLTEQPQFAQLVLRLELHDAPLSPNREVKVELSSIFASLSNLVVCVSPHPSWTQGIEWTMGPPWWPRMRSLTWGTESLSSPHTPWVLRMAPNLEVLKMSHSGFSFADPDRPVHLPRLHTLIFHDSSYPIPLGFHTPSLKLLWSEKPTPQLVCSSLRAVVIPTAPRGREWHDTILPSAIEELLLHRTSFPFQDQPKLGLKRVGIAFETLAMLNQQLSSLSASTTPLTTLKTIRLIPSPVSNAPAPVEWTKIHHTRRTWVLFAHWASIWEERKIVLEDQAGALISHHVASQQPPAPQTVYPLAYEYNQHWGSRELVPAPAAMGFLGLLW
ncbi:hypothetical protein DL93DRAFT_2228321 [Clavulina sp. PMI_390]|nr:hypothetical protein DL93DRAFT_2228321 [Clavulina sp. PMI_390]